MNERREYEMSAEQLERVVDASKPVHYVIIGGVGPRSSQENANQAWRLLGSELGFDWTTVRPVPGKGSEFFTAVPS